MGPTGEPGLKEAQGAVFQDPAGGWSVSSTGCSQAGGSQASGRALGVGLALSVGEGIDSPQPSSPPTFTLGLYPHSAECAPQAPIWGVGRD